MSNSYLNVSIPQFTPPHRLVSASNLDCQQHPRAPTAYHNEFFQANPPASPLCSTSLVYNVDPSSFPLPAPAQAPAAPGPALAQAPAPAPAPAPPRPPEAPTVAATSLVPSVACPDCTKPFQRRCDLNRHIKTHTRPFKCALPDCEFSERGFPTPQELQRHHQDRHSPNPPQYPCLFKPCTYSAKRESNRKQHMAKQHGWKHGRSYQSVASGASGDHAHGGRDENNTVDSSSSSSQEDTSPAAVSQTISAAAAATTAGTAAQQLQHSSFSPNMPLDSVTMPQSRHPGTSVVFLPDSHAVHATMPASSVADFASMFSWSMPEGSQEITSSVFNDESMSDWLKSNDGAYHPYPTGTKAAADLAGLTHRALNVQTDLTFESHPPPLSAFSAPTPTFLPPMTPGAGPAHLRRFSASNVGAETSELSPLPRHFTSAGAGSPDIKPEWDAEDANEDGKSKGDSNSDESDDSGEDDEDDEGDESDQGGQGGDGGDGGDGDQGRDQRSPGRRRRKRPATAAHQMVCPFHVADPDYFNCDNDNRFSPCHTAHQYMSQLLRHLSRAAHNLVVNEHCVHSFRDEAKERLRPQPKRGLCRICWKVFSDEESLTAHIGQHSCRKVKPSNSDMLDILREAFCAPPPPTLGGLPATPATISATISANLADTTEASISGPAGNAGPAMASPTAPALRSPVSLRRRTRSSAVGSGEPGPSVAVSTPAPAASGNPEVIKPSPTQTTPTENKMAAVPHARGDFVMREDFEELRQEMTKKIEDISRMVGELVARAGQPLYAAATNTNRSHRPVDEIMDRKGMRYTQRTVTGLSSSSNGSSVQIILMPEPLQKETKKTGFELGQQHMAPKTQKRPIGEEPDAASRRRKRRRGSAAAGPAPASRQQRGRHNQPVGQAVATPLGHEQANAPIKPQSALYHGTPPSQATSAASALQTSHAQDGSAAFVTAANTAHTMPVSALAAAHGVTASFSVAEGIGFDFLQGDDVDSAPIESMFPREHEGEGGFNEGGDAPWN